MAPNETSYQENFSETGQAAAAKAKETYENGSDDSCASNLVNQDKPTEISSVPEESESGRLFNIVKHTIEGAFGCGHSDEDDPPKESNIVKELKATGAYNTNTESVPELAEKPDKATGNLVNQGKEATNTATDKASEFSEKAQERTGDVVNQGKEATNTATDKASELADDAEEKTGNALNQGKEASATTYRKVVDSVSSAFGLRSKGEKTTEDAKESTKNVTVKEKATDAYNATSETASKWAGKAKEETGNAVNQGKEATNTATDKASDLAGKAKEGTGNTLNRGKEATNAATDKTSDLAGKAKESAGNVVNQGKTATDSSTEKVSELADNTEEKTGNALSDGKEASTTTYRKVVDSVSSALGLGSKGEEITEDGKESTGIKK